MGINLKDYIGKDFLKPNDVYTHGDLWAIKECIERPFKEKTGEIKNKLELVIENGKGTTKDFTLNSTNIKILINLFGENSINLKGKLIVLTVVKVTVNSELKDSIQINEMKSKQENDKVKTITQDFNRFR